jgi:hypothetical protein
MATSKLCVVLLLCSIYTVFGGGVTIDSISCDGRLSTSSNTEITIYGSGFDSISLAGVSISGIPCDQEAILSDEAIWCNANPGLGQDNKVSILAEDASVFSAFIVDFKEAKVYSEGSTVDEIFVDYGSSHYITICGKHFGEASETTDISTYTGRFGVVVQGDLEADVITHCDDRIVAKLPTPGVGSKLKVQLHLGSQVITLPNLLVSYPSPIVTGIKNLANKRATYQHVAIFGNNFGTPSPFVILSATIGTFPCVNVDHVSNTELHCYVIGTGANHEVVVFVNGQSSAPSTTAVGGSTVRYDFPDTTSSGLACVPPFGAADVFNPDMCNCWSGSAPSDNLLGTDCDVHAVCPGRITSQPVVSQFAPSRPLTEFKDDKLWIKQTVPIVKNRRDTIIQFVVPNIQPDTSSPTTAAGTVGSATCFYPGRIWAKKINNLDCLDEYYGALAWTQNQLCGFVKDTAAPVDHDIFKSNLVTSYTETFKKADGSIYFRKISNSFMITVSFLKKVVALTTTPVTVIIADPDAPTSLDVIVNGDALYDVASKKTLITFQTTIAWPYVIHTSPLSGVWTVATDNDETNTVTASAVLAENQPGELECDQVEDTECEQSWILTIDTDPSNVLDEQVCNLKGVIAFASGALYCRDYTNVAVCQTYPTVNFSISIGNTDLCDDGSDADASKGLTAELETFYDADLTVPQAIFQTGDMVYFKLIVNDPSSTIDQITFESIELKAQDGNGAPLKDILLDLSVPTFNVPSEFNITAEFTTPFLKSGVDGVLQFHFRLLRDVLSVINGLSSASSGDMTQQLTVEATINILYHGNQKRTMVASSNMLPAVAHSQISFYDMYTEEELAPHNNDDTLEVDAELDSFFGSPASTVVASVTAVAAAAALVLA